MNYTSDVRCEWTEQTSCLEFSCHMLVNDSGVSAGRRVVSATGFQMLCVVVKPHVKAIGKAVKHQCCKSLVRVAVQEWL